MTKLMIVRHKRRKMRQKERRAWPRMAKLIRVLVLDPEDALQHPYVGWIVDRSQGGLCLAFRRVGLKMGDVFLVKPALSKGQPWITVKVRNGRWRNSRLEIGCQFVRA